MKHEVSGFSILDSKSQNIEYGISNLLLWFLKWIGCMAEHWEAFGVVWLQLGATFPLWTLFENDDHCHGQYDHKNGNTDSCDNFNELSGIGNQNFKLKLQFHWPVAVFNQAAVFSLVVVDLQLKVLAHCKQLLVAMPAGREQLTSGVDYIAPELYSVPRFDCIYSDIAPFRLTPNLATPCTL